eukprot:s1890_g16.t1
MLTRSGSFWDLLTDVALLFFKFGARAFGRMPNSTAICCTFPSWDRAGNLDWNWNKLSHGIKPYCTFFVSRTASAIYTEINPLKDSIFTVFPAVSGSPSAAEPNDPPVLSVRPGVLHSPTEGQLDADDPARASMAQVAVVPTEATDLEDPPDSVRAVPTDEDSAQPEPQGVRFRLPEQGTSEVSDWIKSWSSWENRSLWRYPSKPGSMPEYMCRAFRVKSFSLMTLQLAVVFTIMLTVDHYRVWTNVLTDLQSGHFQDIGQEVIFYSAGFTTLICIMATFCMKERYPINYWLMAVTTLMSGMFWGMTRAVVQTTMHFQIVAILFCSMMGATVASRVLMQRGPKLLILCLAPGWAVGAACNVLVSRLILREVDRIILGSTGLSMLLLCIFSMDAGRYLLLCRPDDFMKVVVSMNSTLMVVVSIPFFVLSFCFIHTGEAVIEDEQESEVPTQVREDHQQEIFPAFPREPGPPLPALPAPARTAEAPAEVVTYGYLLNTTRTDQDGSAHSGSHVVQRIDFKISTLALSQKGG